ncbi:MAG: autotransporter-associated beta strand repeat-containing protein [Thermoguttaceae bacterium]|jgi:autotransporter-associated beta strand protein|nr:autotransporter-associated beta strand repeat-containing protein [Thermoguttaceae bacterium]
MKTLLVFLVAILAVGLATMNATQAATLTYDANTGAFGAQDGAGAGWNTTNQNFWDGASNVPWPNTAVDEAVFGAGAGSAGVVSVGTVTANRITFNAAGTGNYTLSGGTITLAGTTPTLAANVDAVMSGLIAGTGGLTKTGTGILTLSGNSTAFAGSVYVNEGILKIGHMYSLGQRSASFDKVIIASGATVDFNGIWDAGYGYTIAGTGANGTGAIINTGAHIGNGNLQMSNLRLAADAMIGGTGNFALLAPGHAATTLDLAGFTLTKAGDNTFTVSNSTFTSGTIHVAGGTFTQYTRAHNAGAVAFTFANTAGANLSLGSYNLSVGSLAGGGATGGNVALGGNTLTVGGLGTSTTYDGTISGAGGLVKTGAGTLTLTGVNSLTGGIGVNAGVLALGNRNAFGPANTAVTKVVVNSGGTVDLNGVRDATYGYTIAGTGTAGAGAMVNTGAHIDNGTAQTSNIRLAANAMIGGTGNFALLASGHGPTTLDLNGFTLTKAGTNTFTVSNTTFNPGTIHVAGGTVTQYTRAHDAGAVAFTFANTAGANLSLGSYDLSVGSLAGGGSTGGGINLGANRLTVGALGTSTTYAGSISGAGGLTKTGTGTLTLSGNSTFTGSVMVDEGILRIGHMYSLGQRTASFDKVIIASGATVDFNGIVDAGYGYTIAGMGTAGTGAIINTGGHIGNSTLQMSNLRLAADAMIGGTGNFALLAPGYAATTLDLAGFTLTKAGTNTFTVCNTTFTGGSIHIAGGTFAQHRHAHNAGAVAFTLEDTAGANLVLGDYGLTIGSLAGGGSVGGNVALGANTLTVGGLGTSTTYGGTISGTGSLIKTAAGTLTLTGANTFAGGVSIDAGTLLVNNASGSGTGTGPVAVKNGATLGGTGTIAGATTIEDGGRLATGTSIGTLTFGSNLIFDNGAIWDWEFVNNTDGNYDRVLGSNDARLTLPTGLESISLNIFGLDGYSLSAGDSFTLFDGDVYLGADLLGPGQNITDLFRITDNIGWWGDWKVTTGSLILTAVPEPGTWLLLLAALACGLVARRRRG